MTHQNLKPWPKGVSGNPGGFPALPPELKAIKALTASEVNRRIAKYARMTRAELDAALKDKATPMLEVCIAKVFVTSAALGDYSRLNFLLDRAIGKAPVIIDDESQDDLSKLTNEELAAKMRPLLAMLEGTG